MTEITKDSSNFNFINESAFIQKPQRNSATLNYLMALKNQEQISDIGYHFACFIFQQIVEVEESKSDSLVVLLAAKLMDRLQQQDTCLDLTDFQFESLWPDLASCGAPALPDYSKWQGIFAESNVIDSQIADNRKPMFVRGPFLYLARYYHYESIIGERVKEAIGADKQGGWFQKLEKERIDSVLNRLFPLPNTLEPSLETESEFRSEIDWQRRAVENSLNKSFSIICGGPGTGKTTTVVKLLAALTELHLDHRQRNVTAATPLKIQMAAPTGKAALRLTESVGSSIAKLGLPNAIRQLLPVDAVTLHRLLKSRGLNTFYHNKYKPIAADVLIVDEASMVDLSLMAKLMEALPSHCQLILLGDREQLASVEAGNVLAEICSARIECPQPFITELKKSWRFDGKGEIGQLATAIKQGNSRLTLELLKRSEGEVRWFDETDRDHAAILELVVNHHGSLIRESQALDVENEQALVRRLFRHLSKIQLLSCVRQGERGVEGVNAAVSQRLIRKGLIPWHEVHYHGRPIMITQNAYHLELFNGDIGIQLVEPMSGQLMTYFIKADGSLYKLLCQRLPAHDTVYAMTVHKSQGSEFEHTLMLLPENETSLTRELLYTGLTRAKRQFSLCGKLTSVAKAVVSQTRRRSGLGYLIET